MDAVSPHQHFAVDALGQRQPLEDLAEEGEHLRRVLGLHLPLETVDLVHVVRLVVPCRGHGGIRQGSVTPGKGQSPTRGQSLQGQETGRERGGTTQERGQRHKVPRPRPHGSTPGLEVGDTAPQLGDTAPRPRTGLCNPRGDAGHVPTTRERGPNPTTDDVAP